MFREHIGKTIADVVHTSRVYRDPFGEYVSVTEVAFTFTDGTRQVLELANGEMFGPAVVAGVCRHCGDTAIVVDGQTVHPFGTGLLDGHAAEVETDDDRENGEVAEGAPILAEAGPTETDREPEGVWTFFGYWDGDELVIDHAVAGEHESVRVDEGRYEGGLWCATASGSTVEVAEARVRSEYEDVEQD